MQSQERDKKSDTGWVAPEGPKLVMGSYPRRPKKQPPVRKAPTTQEFQTVLEAAGWMTGQSEAKALLHWVEKQPEADFKQLGSVGGLRVNYVKQSSYRQFQVQDANGNVVFRVSNMTGISHPQGKPEEGGPVYGDATVYVHNPRSPAEMTRILGQLSRANISAPVADFTEAFSDTIHFVGSHPSKDRLQNLGQAIGRHVATQGFVAWVKGTCPIEIFSGQRIHAVAILNRDNSWTVAFRHLHDGGSSLIGELHINRTLVDFKYKFMMSERQWPQEMPKVLAAWEELSGSRVPGLGAMGKVIRDELDRLWK